jgi:prevent-host-death family protein
LVKIVNVPRAKTTLSALLAEVEHGEEVVIARNGTPVAKLVPVAPSHGRKTGALRDVPEWRGFTYDTPRFAPATDADLAEEGWE